MFTGWGTILIYKTMNFVVNNGKNTYKIFEAPKFYVMGFKDQ